MGKGSRLRSVFNYSSRWRWFSAIVIDDGHYFEDCLLCFREKFGPSVVIWGSGRAIEDDFLIFFFCSFFEKFHSNLFWNFSSFEKRILRLIRRNLPIRSTFTVAKAARANTNTNRMRQIHLWFRGKNHILQSYETPCETPSNKRHHTLCQAWNRKKNATTECWTKISH